MNACKHGHVDGARHTPCPKCAAESAQEELQQARDALRAVIDIEKRRFAGEQVPEADRRSAFALACAAANGFLVDHIATQPSAKGENG